MRTALRLLVYLLFAVWAQVIVLVAGHLLGLNPIGTASAAGGAMGGVLVYLVMEWRNK